MSATDELTSVAILRILAEEQGIDIRLPGLKEAARRFLADIKWRTEPFEFPSHLFLMSYLEARLEEEKPFPGMAVDIEWGFPVMDTKFPMVSGAAGRDDAAQYQITIVIDTKRNKVHFLVHR